MSNIYEALAQAQKERKEGPLDPAPGPAIAPQQVCGAIPRLSMDTEMFSLYQHVESLLADFPQKSIQFVACREGEGVSTIVREFARCAVSRFGKKVLIMDAAHHNPSQHIYFNIECNYGWKDALGRGEPVNKACYQADSVNLFLSPITSRPGLTQPIHSRSAATALFRELKTLFDLILIDSSPVTASPDTLDMARFADGVVMVLQAEKTRRQMVENLREKIERNGGNILGVVLNKRKYYIPQSIYRRL